MKRGSMAQIWMGRPSREPLAEISASERLVAWRLASRPLAIRLAVDETERIGGAQAGVELHVLAAIQEQLEAGDGIQAGVRSAFGADVSSWPRALFSR